MSDRRVGSTVRTLLAGLIGSALAPAAAAAATVVCGTIADTTWSATSSPYSVCTSGATVAAGTTLTIDPGVVVEFQQSAGNKLTVQGTLDAVGTAEQPITFTGATAAAGSWGGLSIDGSVPTPAVAMLRSVVVEYGGVNGSYGAAISVDRGVLTLAHGTVRSSAGSGVYATTRATPTLDSSGFSGNGRDAVLLESPTGDLPFTNLTASGNGRDAVHVTGLNVHVSGQRRWTAPGLPLIVDTLLINTTGDVLTLDPGTELRFGTNTGFEIGGRLDAIGTPARPILLTAQTAAPGGWRGILVYGGAQPAVAQLEHATLEYGGGDIAGANLEVENGQVVASHDVIRAARLDGVLVDNNATVSIQNSQITENSRYGVDNGQPSRPVLASDDWWGDASGPQSDLSTCPSGSGQRITAGVVFRPVLSDPAGSVPVPLSAVPMVAMAPRRWFAPADGQTRVYVDVTVRDGNGTPLPGRTVRLASSLGTVVDGGITDADGKTLAYLTSAVAGDADLVASLDAATCEDALSPMAQVTFTTPLSVTDLFPDSPAPYLGNGIQVAPLPVVAGVTTTITATLVNPLPSSITVDAAFGFVQSSIGLAFGPIKDIVGQVIPAQSSTTLTASFVPPVSGHYCVEVTYTITAVGATAAAWRPRGTGSGRRQLNLKVYQPPTGPPKKQDGLKKTREALDMMQWYPAPRAVRIPNKLLRYGVIDWNLNMADKIDKALQGDPPRQDYELIDRPQKVTLPPVASDDQTSAAMAAAVNALADALAEANAAGVAAAVALDRAGGASEAGDLEWASVQEAALLEYNRQTGEALATAASKIDGVLAVAAAEGITSDVVSAADVTAVQQALAATGFDADAVATAHAVGLTDADIEDLRQGILAAHADDLAGDLVVRLRELRDRFLDLGDALAHPEVFAPTLAVSGAARADSAGNTLVHLYDLSATVPVGNPLGGASTIDVRARRVGLPADWAVDVTPPQVTLPSGAQTTVTVNVVAGSPIPQGAVPRVAVEGWAGTTLLGGVTIDVVAPRYATLPPAACASITDCYTALGVTLPDPAAASGKKAKRAALKLQKRYRSLGALLTRAAATSGKRRTKRYVKARRIAQALLAAARHADGKGTLGVSLATVEDAVAALLAQFP
ncbi:MAG: Ig-like domain-containing protein [Candidatus Binatia bacterium]